MRTLKFPGAFVAAAIVMGGTALAEVKTNVAYKGYPVYGSTVQEIWRDIGKKGPHQLERGLYAQAEAEIRFGWKTGKFETDIYKEKSFCRVVPSRILVTVRVVILLPHWVDYARSKPDLQEAWDRYIAKVRRHEDHHKDVALAAADQLDQALRSAPAYSDCDHLERALKAKADQILERERAQQAHFDRTDKPIMLTGGR